MSAPKVKDLFAAFVLPATYQNAVSHYGHSPKAWNLACLEAWLLSDRMMDERNQPDPKDDEIAALRRTIAAFKANATRRKAKL